MLDGKQLQEVGTPHCDCKDDQEMELQEEPILTVLKLYDGETELDIGVALRPADMLDAKFRDLVSTAWREWIELRMFPFGGNNFIEFLEKQGIEFLKTESVLVVV